MTESTHYVAGHPHHALAKVFRNSPEFPKGLPLKLVRDPQNPYDPLAIGIWLERKELDAIRYPVPVGPATDWQLGFVPAKDGTNRELAPLMDVGQVVTCAVDRHTSNGGLMVTISYSYRKEG